VIAVVGNEVVLSSDIEQEMIQLKAQGQIETENIYCEVLEQLLIQKLLLVQAKVDSLKVNEVAVSQEVDKIMRYYAIQMGGQEDVEKYFGKPMHILRESMNVRIRERNLTQQMQHEIVKDVQVTPKDVERFYNEQAPDSFPMIPEQYIIQQIAKYPPSGSEARFLVRERLLELRERVMNGEKFQALAVMYSEDPGTVYRGGEMGFMPREELVKSFADVAFTLKPGQVSQIVETEFGYHIIQMVERKDDLANVRHILLRPKFSAEMREEAMHQLDSIVALLRSDSMSFEYAAYRFSEDKNTRLNGGYVINAQTQTDRFEKDQLIPADYFALRNMKVGDISSPFESKDQLNYDIFKIIRLKELIPSHRANFEQDYGVIQNLAESKKQRDVFTKWIRDHVKAAVVTIDSSVDCKFEYNWQKK
jgi:peptidyl-prolyl cis-trans isomerase SurA